MFAEASEAAQAIVGRNERQQSREAAKLAEESTRLADHQTRLTAVATLFLLIQPLLLLFDPLPWWCKAVFSFVCTFGALLLILAHWKKLTHSLEQVAKRYWVYALVVFLVVLLLGLGGALLVDQTWWTSLLSVQESSG